MVYVSPEGKVIAYFTDFEPVFSTWNAEKDYRLFQERLVEDVRTSLQPEVVARNRERREALQQRMREQGSCMASAKKQMFWKAPTAI